MKNITKLMIVAAVAVFVLGFASQASAITLAIGDSRYLGSVTNAEPSNPASEVIYINNLIDILAPGSTTIDGRLYTRTAASCGACTDAVLAGFQESAGENPTGTIPGGFTYAYGKYGNTAHIWFVGGLATSNELPSTAPGGGLSHWAVFNPGTTSVPEPSSLLLIGSALAAIGAAGRWFRR